MAICADFWGLAISLLLSYFFISFFFFHFSHIVISVFVSWFFIHIWLSYLYLFLKFELILSQYVSYMFIHFRQKFYFCFLCWQYFVVLYSIGSIKLVCIVDFKNNLWCDKSDVSYIAKMYPISEVGASVCCLLWIKIRAKHFMGIIQRYVNKKKQVENKWAKGSDGPHFVDLIKKQKKKPYWNIIFQLTYIYMTFLINYFFTEQ